MLPEATVSLKELIFDNGSLVMSINEGQSTASFMSTWHKLHSLWKREPLLRKCQDWPVGKTVMHFS